MDFSQLFKAVQQLPQTQQQIATLARTAERTPQFEAAVQLRYGMQTFNQALATLVLKKQINRDLARVWRRLKPKKTRPPCHHECALQIALSCGSNHWVLLGRGNLT